MNKIKISLLGFLFLLLSRIVFAVDIDNCSELNETNIEYYLTENITGFDAFGCINITANNIILDCQNNLIDGQTDLGTYGIIFIETLQQQQI